LVLVFFWGFISWLPISPPPDLLFVIILGAMGVCSLIFCIYCVWRKAWKQPWVHALWPRLAMLLCYASCLCFAAPPFSPYQGFNWRQMPVYHPVLALLLLFTGFWPIFRHTRQLLRESQYTLFYALAARASLLVNAVAVLLLLCTLAPYLSHHEVMCIRRDRLIFPSHGELTPLAIEAQIIPELQQKMLRILHEQ